MWYPKEDLQPPLSDVGDSCQLIERYSQRMGDEE